MHNGREYYNQFITPSIYGKSEIELKQFIKGLENTLPPVFSRKQVSDALGGCLSVKTLMNLDSLGKGPYKMNLGKKVIYEKDSFLEWLKNKLQG